MPRLPQGGVDEVSTPTLAPGVLFPHGGAGQPGALGSAGKNQELFSEKAVASLRKWGRIEVKSMSSSSIFAAE